LGQVIFRFVLALLGATVFIALSACGGADLSFDKEKWASGRGNFEGKNPRGLMVSDAEEAGVKVGATRASIRALLGAPDSTGPESDTWYLGRNVYGLDYENLKIKYDKNEIATEVRVLQT
jgi:outer membrane protein assembly factor BamE (lipoprotein component of BamABCDE complex)